MKQKDIITYVVIAGGVYGLYWYLNNYGPQGKVAVSGGAGSYWDNWFGAGTAAQPAAAAPAAPAAPVSAPTQAPTSPAVPTLAPGTGTTSPPPHGTAAGPSLRSALLTASGGVNSLDIDQWSYYVAQVSGKAVDGSTIGVMLQNVSNRAQTMDVDTYLSALAQALGGSTPATPSPTHGGRRAMGDIVDSPTTKGTGMGNGSGMRFRSPWGRLPASSRVN